MCDHTALCITLFSVSGVSTVIETPLWRNTGAHAQVCLFFISSKLPTCKSSCCQSQSHCHHGTGLQRDRHTKEEGEEYTLFIWHISCQWQLSVLAEYKNIRYTYQQSIYTQREGGEQPLQPATRGVTDLNIKLCFNVNNVNNWHRTTLCYGLHSPKLSSGTLTSATHVKRNTTYVWLSHVETRATNIHSRKVFAFTSCCWKRARLWVKLTLA